MLNKDRNKIFEFFVDSLNDINTDILQEFLIEHQVNVVNYNKRESIFLNEMDVDNTYIKNKYKIKINKAKEIVLNLKGYILADEIKFLSDKHEIAEELNDFFDKNNENMKNDKHLENMLKFGVSYEIVYQYNGALKFSVINPKDCFLIYNNEIEQEPIMGVRIIRNRLGEIVKIETFDNNYTINKYVYSVNGLVLESEGYHTFSQCPIICFSGNEYHSAIFDDITDEINTVNNALTTYINNVINNNNAPAYFYGLDEGSESFHNFINENEELNKNDVANIILNNERLKKKYGFIPAEMDFKIEYPIRPNENEANNNIITQLMEIIYSATQTVNLSNYRGDVSGRAMKIKMKATDTIASEKIYYMETALRKRIELIFDFWNKVNNNKKYDANTITISFQKQNFEDMVEISSSVKNFKEAGYSQRDIFAKDPQIQDIQAALNNIVEEKQQEEEEFVKTYLKNK